MCILVDIFTPRVNLQEVTFICAGGKATATLKNVHVMNWMSSFKYFLGASGCLVKLMISEEEFVYFNLFVFFYRP